MVTVNRFENRIDQFSNVWKSETYKFKNVTEFGNICECPVAILFANGELNMNKFLSGLVRKC